MSCCTVQQLTTNERKQKMIAKKMIGWVVSALIASQLGWIGPVAMQDPAGKPAAVEASAKKPARPGTSSAAREAMRGAKALEEQVKGKKDAERLTALEQAARAFEKVALDFAAEPGAAAAARFSEADLWRRHGSLALAEQAFLAAASLDAARFGQRGTIEAADMQRRQKKLEAALQGYAAAAAMDPASSRAHDARLWQARLLQEMGKPDEALELFRAALESAEKPRLVIEAANFLARALIEKGDLDGASRAIGHAEEAVQGAAEDDAAEGQRLRKLLEDMSSRKALQRARDKQTGAARDAQQLEAAQKAGGGSK